MLMIQAVPAPGRDAYKLLRGRIREAPTWEWANKAKTRLRHVQRKDGGYISIASAGGVLVATVVPKTPSDQFYLAEKFTGRLIAWFDGELVAINMQPAGEVEQVKARKRR
jgi:hypothetical protein